MSLFDDFLGLIGDLLDDSCSTVSHDSSMSEINPATGLPMCDGTGSFDVAGNPYGFSNHDDHGLGICSSGFDDHGIGACSSSVDDHGSCFDSGDW